MSDEPNGQSESGQPQSTQQGSQSGQPQSTQQGGQSGQPQSTQQGGQSGQPQNTPRGGQAGQPQGADAPQRAPNGQAGSGGVDISPVIQEWATFITILFAIGGGASGVMLLLFDSIDQPLLEASGGGFGGAIGGSLYSSAILVIGGLVPIMLAVFIGAYLSGKIQGTGEDPIQVAAASVGLGTLVAFILVSFIGTLTLDGVSIAFGGVLINGIISALVAAGAAAGGVWTMQNQAP